MSWKRSRQAARIALGICPDCDLREAAPGGKRCAECRDQQNAKHRRQYAQSRRMGIPRFTADVYREKAQEKQELRSQRREQGLCIQCGGTVQRFIRCVRCREKGARAKARHKMRAKAQEINRIRGVAA